MTAPAVARAEGSDPLADTFSLTDEEVAVVNSTAAGLAGVETNGGIRLEDGTFQAFDFDMLFEALDSGHTNQTAHSVLPGGVVGVLALAAGQCALGEI